MHLPEDPAFLCGSDYPGLLLSPELLALESYLAVLERQIENAKSHYLHLANSSRRNGMADDVFAEIEVEAAESAAALVPQFFRQGALIAIWGLFESFVSAFAAFSGRRLLPKFSFRDVRAANFRQQSERFFEAVLQIPLPWTVVERTQLAALQEIRNCCAHSNGRLGDLSATRLREVEAQCGLIDGATVVNGSLRLSARSVEASYSLVVELLSALNRVLINKFAPRDEHET